MVKLTDSKKMRAGTHHRIIVYRHKLLVLANMCKILYLKDWLCMELIALNSKMPTTYTNVIITLH